MAVLIGNFDFISSFCFHSLHYEGLFLVNFSYCTLVHLASRVWKIYERISFFRNCMYEVLILVSMYTKVLDLQVTKNVLGI